jgi:hypothetical protein
MTRQPSIRFSAEMAAALWAGKKTSTWRMTFTHERIERP